MADNVDTILNLSQKLLVYISLKEPIDSFSDLFETSEIDEETLKLNLWRLKNANLIDGIFSRGLGSRHFVNAQNVSLTYEGAKEVMRLKKENKLIKGAVLKLGLLEINL